MKKYDPECGPDPARWLASAEDKRIDAVRAYHRRFGGFGQDLLVHASIHVIVENQLALGQPREIQTAMSRLLGEGLARHDAIHAVASVLAEHLFPILEAQGDPPSFDHSGYALALANLTSARWREVQ